VDIGPPCKTGLGINAAKNGMEGSWVWAIAALKTANAEGAQPDTKVLNLSA
jgi:hypothetical protein